MEVSSTRRHFETQTDTYPLLMEQSNSLSCSEHIVDIPRRIDASSSVPNDRTTSGLEASSLEDRTPNSTSIRTQNSRISTATASSNGSNNRGSTRRGESRRRRSPLNSGLWISVELVLTVGQIIASIVVLAVSRHENPRAPLFAWIVGYALGCVATLPLLYWRFYNRNQVSEQESAQNRQGSAHISVPAGSFSVSVSRNMEVEERRPSPRSGQNSAVINARLKTMVEYLKMALDCFFAVWFVVGNVWIFGGHSSATDAPNMYRLCIVFLTFSCIGYAMPFILCATICCCLPCIISLLGFREDLGQTRGATSESIDALPTYKFKLNKNRNGGDNNSVAGDGGTVAAGTEHERSISGEDAVCCICLAKYANNDELRELPCCHFFHKECVDKWLKINASCPLCKNEVGQSVLGSLSGSNSGQQSGLASAMF